ncbi:Attractin-like protein 1 [Balamuthia mandrillaris]
MEVFPGRLPRALDPTSTERPETRGGIASKEERFEDESTSRNPTDAVALHLDLPKQKGTLYPPHPQRQQHKKSNSSESFGQHIRNHNMQHSSPHVFTKKRSSSSQQLPCAASLSLSPPPLPAPPSSVNNTTHFMNEHTSIASSLPPYSSTPSSSASSNCYAPTSPSSSSSHSSTSSASASPSFASILAMFSSAESTATRSTFERRAKKTEEEKEKGNVKQDKKVSEKEKEQEKDKDKETEQEGQGKEQQQEKVEPKQEPTTDTPLIDTQRKQMLEEIESRGRETLTPRARKKDKTEKKKKKSKSAFKPRKHDSASSSPPSSSSASSSSNTKKEVLTKVKARPSTATTILAESEVRLAKRLQEGPFRLLRPQQQQDDAEAERDENEDKAKATTKQDENEGKEAEEESRWRKEVPEECYGHSMVLDEHGGGVMFVFGGCNNEGKFCTGLYYYNIESNDWSKYKGTGLPHGRHFHSAVLHDGCMYIFGGTSNGYYNDLFRFHLESQEWKQIKAANKGPSPRYGHSAVVYENSMYIFGGYDKDGLECNDLYAFNFATITWRKLKTKGIWPKDRYLHSAVVYQGSMYLFGGYKCFNELIEYRFGTETWSLVNTKGPIPRPRWGHTAVVYNGRMYIFGGRDAVGTLDDFYDFCFETSTWRRLNNGGITDRAFHSAAVHDGNMYIFGGRNVFHFSFNELLKCPLDLEYGRIPDTIVEDFGSLLDDPLLSDICFVFPNKQSGGGGDKVIHAHKNILAFRCTTFRAMLNSGMKESNCGVIVVDTVSYDIFYAMLEYLYTGEMRASPHMLVELLGLANQYQLEHLKYLCEQKIMRYVDMDNALNLLLHADQFRAPDLRGCTIGYIVRNFEELTSRHQGSTELQRIERDCPALAKEIRRKVTLALAAAAANNKPEQ